MAESHGDSWLEKLKKAEKTCSMTKEKRKIFYQFPEGEMMEEEYDLRTNLISVRRWRRKTVIGRLLKWEFEIGEPQVEQHVDHDGIREDASNPFFFRVDTADEFQWKIRNLPYPLSTYTVDTNPAKNMVIVKTANKKYYKEFSIPDLERCGLLIDSNQLIVSHSSNTLKIKYKKPTEVLALEKDLCKELRKLNAVNVEEDKCQTS